MTEPTDRDPAPDGDTEWLIADEPAPDVASPPAGRRTALAAVGLGQRLPGQNLPGGVTGEQRLSGTVTAVGASSVTIRTASGTADYGVTAQSEIVRNGALASLSAVRRGDSVFVHLIPSSGSSYVVERLFAQSAGGSSSDDSSGSTT